MAVHRQTVVIKHERKGSEANSRGNRSSRRTAFLDCLSGIEQATSLEYRRREGNENRTPEQPRFEDRLERIPKGLYRLRRGRREGRHVQEVGT